MLLAGLEQQCIVLRCNWWLLGFYFCLHCVPFYDIFYFPAFSFIASVKVIEDDRIPLLRQNPNLHTRLGIDAVKF